MDLFCPLLAYTGGVTMVFTHVISNSKYFYHIEKFILSIFHWCLFLYVSAFFSRYKPLTFGILSYTADFLCRVYYIIKNNNASTQHSNYYCCHLSHIASKCPCCNTFEPSSHVRTFTSARHVRTNVMRKLSGQSTSLQRSQD